MSAELPATNNSDFSEFLNDYFVECDEHLSTARRCLLNLEPRLQEPNLDRSLLDELFRSFHSLKGLSAMVGFQEAEQVAHQLETYLVAVRNHQARLEPAGNECLMAAVFTLERIIAARRDSSPLPEIAPLMVRLAALRQLDDAQSSADTQPKQSTATDFLVTERTREGLQAWEVTFTPSPELISRGIDVTAVRARLIELGELIQSAPAIGADGRIAFHFVLLLKGDQDPSQLSRLEGATYAPYAKEAATAGVAAIMEPESVERRERPSTHLIPANVVRVDLERIDELMRLVGELVLSRARLQDGLQEINGQAPAAGVRALQETSSAIERQLRDLREGIMRVRMIPIRDVFNRMQFVVRDMLRDADKQVALNFVGEETQIDKYIVERIMDPLLHLVRNAVSHGLESSSERTAIGKLTTGQLFLRARSAGETIIIEVEDDGRGIDLDRLFARAQTQGLLAPHVERDFAAALDILCLPGFSTRDEADRESGRGVGMDVVRRTVEELGGTLRMQSAPQKGTSFHIQLPLTLAIIDALIVEIGQERYAVPQSVVREIVRVEADRVTRMESNDLLTYRDNVLPLIYFAYDTYSRALLGSAVHALIVGEGNQAKAFAIDRVIGLREIVVRPLTDRLIQVPELAGATELGDGRVVLILNTSQITTSKRRTLEQGLRSLNLSQESVHGI